MKIIKALPKVMALLFIVLTVVSCDEDFNTIGIDIVGDDNLLTSLDDTHTVVAYSRKLDPVQTNYLPIHKLGKYKDPFYGTSTANYISQLVMQTADPTFADEQGQEVELDSVILYMPYFHNTTIEDEETIYTLDSVYGNSPIKLSIYESKYYLRDLDPNTSFEEAQLYYSNQGSDFEANLGELWATIEEFTPSNEEYIFIENEGTDEEVETIITPGLRVELPIDYFKEKILDMEGSPVLINNNNFKEYLRGIYFKVESLSEEGSLFMFNPSIANITLYYSYDKLDEDGEPELDEDGEPIIEKKEYILQFGGNNLNVYEDELPQEVLSNLENPNSEEGEETLYIRGGDGILTVIDLFGEDVDDNGVADELEVLREKQWIINDANLIFYVDTDIVEGGETEPDRIIIYNLETNTVLSDYFIDTTSGNDPDDAMTIHLGKLERDSDGNGEYYKIRITNYISNVINKDSTNVSLGVIVTQNVLLNGFQTIDSLTNPEGTLPRIKKVPRGSVTSPEGTVLYGNNTSNEEKKLKLQLYYTEVE